MTNTASKRINIKTISERLQAAGVCGAGGAGFPSYIKWRDLAAVDRLLVNHQESEPNYYADKWLGREHAEELRSLVQALLDIVFDAVVFGTKQKYRAEWTGDLEDMMKASTYSPKSLPIDIEAESDVVFAYTPNVYTYSEETVLLMVTVGLQIGDDLPTDHGWIVHNTETLYNIYRALDDGTPVTRKYVHVDGNTPRHRCLDVPVGTPATTLLKAAGLDPADLDPDQVLADGGPGWCYEIESPPKEFGVRKRTNAIIVLDEDVVQGCTAEDGEINVLDAYDWDRDHETEPTRLEPDSVRIPLLTNEAYRGLVEPSIPVVTPGDVVSVGEIIAVPHDDGISNTQHASINGTVDTVTDAQIVLRQ